MKYQSPYAKRQRRAAIWVNIGYTVIGIFAYAEIVGLIWVAFK